MRRPREHGQGEPPRAQGRRHPDSRDQDARGRDKAGLAVRARLQARAGRRARACAGAEARTLRERAAGQNDLSRDDPRRQVD